MSSEKQTLSIEEVSKIVNNIHIHPLKSTNGRKVGFFSKSEEEKGSVQFQVGKHPGVKCRLPFGISAPMEENTTSDKRTLQIALRSKDEVSFIKQLDDFVIKTAVARTDNWFPHKKAEDKLTERDIRRLYKPMLEIPDNEEYDPMVKTKITISGKQQTKVFIMREINGKFFHDEGTLDDVRQGAECLVALRLGYMWFTASQFGATLLIPKIVVFPQATGRDDFDFICGSVEPLPEHLKTRSEEVVQELPVSKKRKLSPSEDVDTTPLLSEPVSDEVQFTSI